MCCLCLCLCLCLRVIDRLFRLFQHEAGKTKCLVNATKFLQWLKENQEAGEEEEEEEEEEEGSD